MTTALRHQRVQDTPSAHPAALSRLNALGKVAGLRHTSPGRLQLLLATLLTLAALTALVTGLAARSASAGTADLGGRSQPLLTEAETIYSALADANTTAAQAFLAGGLEPVKLTEHYDLRLAEATTALISASRRTPENSEAARAVRELATGTTRYAALVATARAVNRQGLPVGASYLATASQLNQETLQPQAQALFQIARSEVDAGYREARAEWWLVLLLVLLVTLGFTLISTQVYLSGATNRTFNVPLVAATVLAFVLAMGCWSIFSDQRLHLGEADESGSAPIAAVAEMRILALRERADEALTLAARSGSGTLETDFQAVQKQLIFTDHGMDSGWDLMDRARDEHTAYVKLHERVRALDDGGDYEGAVELAIGQETTTAFETLIGTLDEALEDRKAFFTDEIRAATWGLGPLTVLGPLLALMIGVLAAAGLRTRLEEYR